MDEKGTTVLQKEMMGYSDWAFEWGIINPRLTPGSNEGGGVVYQPLYGAFVLLLAIFAVILVQK